MKLYLLVGWYVIKLMLVIMVMRMTKYIYSLIIKKLIQNYVFNLWFENILIVYSDDNNLNNLKSILFNI